MSAQTQTVDTLDIFRKAAQTATGESFAGASYETTFAELGLDSLKVAETLANIEDELRIDIPWSRAREIRSIQDLSDLVHELLEALGDPHSLRILQEQSKAAGKQGHRLIAGTAPGSWLHSPGEDWLLAFVSDFWDEDSKAAVSRAYQEALRLLSKIESAIEELPQDGVVNGIPRLDESRMTEVMSSISGMGKASVRRVQQSGEGTASSVGLRFFPSVYPGTLGSPDEMARVFSRSVANLQNQLKKNPLTEFTGAFFGLVFLNPAECTPVTTLQYVYAARATTDWLADLDCSSQQIAAYDYSVTVVDYIYQA